MIRIKENKKERIRGGDIMYSSGGRVLNEGLPFTTYSFMLRHQHEATAEDMLLRNGGGSGSWFHAACHLVTAITSSASLAPLPFAITTLGWPAGVGTLTIFALISFYCSMCIASLWEWDGVAYSSYRDLIGSIFGRAGYYIVVCCQGLACFGKSIIIQIAAGKCLKAIYNAVVKREAGMMMIRIQECMAVFGVVQLGLSQFPGLHCMRWLNALCSFSTVGFTAMAVGTLVSQEKQESQGTVLDHQLGNNSLSSQVLVVFSALGSIAFSLSDALLPEIQSTLKEPVKQRTVKGLWIAYAMIVSTAGTIGCVGSWALGSAAHPFFIDSLKAPPWQLILLHACSTIQLAGCYQMYCQPTYSFLESKLMSVEGGPFSLRNCLTRFFATSLYTALVTLVAAAMPFFGSFASLVGALGFTLLDVVMPVLAYTRVQQQKLSFLGRAWHFTIALSFILVAFVGSTGALKFVVSDIRKCGLFRKAM